MIYFLSMKSMRGFIEIPIIVIIFLITGGAITAYSVSHKTNTSLQKVALKEKESTSSAQLVIPSSITQHPINNNKVTPSLTVSTLVPSQVASTPNPTSTPQPTVTTFTTSSVTISVAPPGNSLTPNASGQVSLELDDLIPYYTTGKLASFGKVSGTFSGLQPNTDYALAFSSPSDSGAIELTKFHTNESGSGTVSNAGAGISYVPVNPVWTVKIFSGGNSSVLSLTGNFSIGSDNTLSR